MTMLVLPGRPSDVHDRRDLPGPPGPPDPPDLMPLPIIAIDGPSGAGKGTVAREVAIALGYRHVDSGAMYRAVGWKALQEHVALDSDEAVSKLASASRIDVSTARVLIDGTDVTRAIRTP